MASSIASILTDIAPKRLATVESAFKKTELSPRQGEKFFLDIKMNLDIRLGKVKKEIKDVIIIITGNANVFAGQPDNPHEKRQLAEFLVKIEAVYQAHATTTEDDLKRHSDFFKGQSTMAVYYALRSLVANTNFYDMPIPFA